MYIYVDSDKEEDWEPMDSDEERQTLLDDSEAPSVRVHQSKGSRE